MGYLAVFIFTFQKLLGEFPNLVAYTVNILETFYADDIKLPESSRLFALVSLFFNSSTSVCWFGSILISCVSVDSSLQFFCQILTSPQYLAVVARKPTILLMMRSMSRMMRSTVKVDPDQQGRFIPMNRGGGGNYKGEESVIACHGQSPCDFSFGRFLTTPRNQTERENDRGTRNAIVFGIASLVGCKAQIIAKEHLFVEPHKFGCIFADLIPKFFSP